ncbi:hypothetical protein [Pseudovibrio sp. POLY-S9]|uniref:hypothetical protein n=1 Tax=Pseudovibrio sp. POLY-S9 TaxID=1576596 RepID=UPI00070F179E|nr:hypothetical protein [Pseudovibrio sp. POLY-S9]
MASEAEREIRSAVVARLREVRPKARIIHELKVFHGQNRVDLAAVSLDEIILVEIKSKKDTLARLQDQANACQALSNHSLILLHEKHLERGHTEASQWNKAYSYALVKQHKGDFIHIHNSDLWVYPQLPEGDLLHCRVDDWNIEKKKFSELPPVGALLDLLWVEEQLSLADSLGISLKGCNTKDKRAQRISFHATGEQVLRGVCWQLRGREFATADAPISYKRAA